jgi:hypothetical protein
MISSSEMGHVSILNKNVFSPVVLNQGCTTESPGELVKNMYKRPTKREPPGFGLGGVQGMRSF